MRSGRAVSAGGLIILFCLFSWLLPSVGNADPHKLTCGKEKTIGEAIHELKPGDVLLVSGVCKENVIIREEVHRITLDGQGTATINGGPATDSGPNVVEIRGSGITIRGFTITGGRDGINVNSGGTATVDGNLIENTGRNGVLVNNGSYVRIINNTIQNNPEVGIDILGGSAANIGFVGTPSARVGEPNVIQNNAIGIVVGRIAIARIEGNTIRNNTGDGVIVQQTANASIIANTIDGNGGHGIQVREGSGVNLGTDATGATPEFNDDVNTGTNGGFGIRCRIGGYASGNIGTLTGASGAQKFESGCIDNVTP